MVRAQVIFKGRVQGVFFRVHTKERADELGVKGWVRNLNTGEVEAVFEGDESLVNELIEYCKSGQPYAKVSYAIVEYGEGKGSRNEFRREFEIRY
jgi:acylphosphatase